MYVPALCLKPNMCTLCKDSIVECKNAIVVCKNAIIHDPKLYPCLRLLKASMLDIGELQAENPLTGSYLSAEDANV